MMTSAKCNRHPCFSDQARCTYGRIHLPVARDCNVACIYCNRSYDCVNEARPGVTSRLLSAEEACAWLERALAIVPNLSVAAIAGPGDPLANPRETFATFALVRKRHPELLLCLSTNGLVLPKYVDELVACGVSHVTVTVNAVDPELGGTLYHWVLDGGIRYTGLAAGKLLLARQKEGVLRLQERGVLIKINTVLLQENGAHAQEIAKEVASWGVARMNCIPLIPVPGTKKALAEPLPPKELERIRSACEVYVPQMRSCERCRADAVGLLGNSKPLATILDQ